MECEGVLKLASLPLKILAEIAVAQHFWKRSDIIRRMNEDFEQEVVKAKYDFRILYVLLGVGTVVNYINEQIDLLPIPGKLALEIKIIASRLWQKACYWRRHVIISLHLDVKYAEKIYWTSHGEIDQEKIVCDFWLKDNEFPSIYLKRSLRIYCTALIYAVKNFDNENLEKLINEFLEEPPFESKEVLGTSIIIAKWVSVSRNCLEKQDIDIYLVEQSVEPSSCKEPVVPLFCNCVTLQFEFGVKYFWNKLSCNEKTIWVTWGATICVTELEKLLDCRNNQWLLKGDSFNAIKIESILKILLFLINEMEDFPKLDFFSKYFVVTFQALSVIWPYQELCFQSLYTILSHIQCNKKQFLKSVLLNYANRERRERIGEYYYKYGSLDLASHNPMISYAGEKIFNRLVAAIMDLLSKKSKESVFIGNNFEMVRELYEIKFYATLNIVINDIHLVEYKETILEIALDYLKKILLSQEFNCLNKFFEAVELDEEKSKWLKRLLIGLDTFLTPGGFKAADKFLNWYSDVDKEREELKIHIDAVKITEELIRMDKLLDAERFLRWRFETEGEREEFKIQIDAVKITEELIRRDKLLDAEIFIRWRFEPGGERIGFKKSLASEDSISNKIFYILGHSHYALSKKYELCNRLLNFFFGSDAEVINFQRDKLKPLKEKLVLEYWNGSCKSRKAFKNLDKFLEFISLSSKEIEAMKANLSNDAILWIDTYALDGNENYEMVQALFMWVYGNNFTEVKNVIGKYMKSPKGSLLIIKLFEKVSQESFFETSDFDTKLYEKNRITYFLNSSVTGELLNISLILENLARLEETVKGVNISGIIKLLEKRKEGPIDSQFIGDNFWKRSE